MNTELNNYSLQKDIDTVIAVLPPVIRAYLARGEHTKIVRNLMAKYGLRVDQSGVLERGVTLLLMGIENPSEFTQALINDAKLSQQVVNSIVQDINTQIFIPLRKEEEEKDTVAPQPVRGIEGVRPTPPPQAAAQVPRTPTSSSDGDQHFFHLQNKIPTASRTLHAATPSTAPVRVVAGPSTLAQAIENALDAKAKATAQSPRPTSSHIAPLPPKTILPTMSRLAEPKSMSADRMLEDREEKHIEFKAPQVLPSTPVEARSAPVLPKVELEVPLRPAVAISGGGPNLPGTMPEVPVPAPAPKVESRAEPSTVETKNVPLSSGASYGADPYREPIDESPTTI